MKSNKKDLIESIKDLSKFLKDKLQLETLPKLKILEDQKNADNPFGYTGNYDNKNKLISIYITDRHPTDVLRTFSHETVHYWQDTNGQLDSETNETGDGYAQKNKHLRKMEKQAYLLGCMYFRDWQDKKRNESK